MSYLIIGGAIKKEDRDFVQAKQLGNTRGREKREREPKGGLTKEKEQRLMIDNIYWIYISK